ncbi:colicin immunity domain-containing protein [Streptomyces sp. HUAS TT7]|uniref:colicin immunity domain-containing protein n=1 Tax=Streptomyces sp. HUAS TT7 TaxID=3447507 RepID=UPI003F65CDD9
MTSNNPITCGELTGALLSTPHRFSGAWLAEGGKSEVPLPGEGYLDLALAQRTAAGARTAGFAYVLSAPTGPEAESAEPQHLPADAEAMVGGIRWPGEPVLLSLPDLTGAILLTGDGYALAAGRRAFIEGAVPEGADQARAAFSRYGRRVAVRHPAVAEVAADFTGFQRTWNRAAHVVAGSGVDHQLVLMNSFSADGISAEAFAREWLEARRRSLNAKERIGQDLSSALEEVFYALEDFPIDPSLRDESDLTVEQLRAVVMEALRRADGA